MSLLNEYYLTNYSKCLVDDSFLASWKGFAFISHLTQIIGFPLQLLTFYLILKKTPENMKSIKQPLLLSHFWCTMLDVHFSTLVTPLAFFPLFSYLPVGLLRALGVPVQIQSACMIITVIFVILSLIYVFESRSRAIQANRFKMESTTSRFIYYSILHVILFQILLLGFKIPENQELAKLESLKALPCPPKEFFDEWHFVVLSDPFWIRMTLLFILPIFVVLLVSNISFHASCCIYYLYIAPGTFTSTSLKTRLNQQRFFIGILVQSCAPMVVLAIPYAAIVIAMALHKITQLMTNLAFISFGLHGIVESICVIVFHSSYRKSIRLKFKKNVTIKIISGHRSIT